MISHARFEMLAAASLDFTLSDGEAAELRRHLAGCSGCSRFAAALRADAARAAARPREDAPPRIRAAISAKATHREATITPGRVGALVAAMMIVVALAGGTALLLGRDQGPAHLGLRSFSLLPGRTPFGYGLVSDVMPFGSGLLAAGSSQAGGTSTGAVWHSIDGLTWVQESPSALVTGTIVTRLATDGRATVALGQDCPAQSQTACGISHVWRSTDGQTWTTVSDSFGTCCGSGVGVAYIGLTSGRAGFTLAGGAYSLGPSGPSLIGAGIANSADGLAWRFARGSDPALLGGSIGGIADGPAGLVAVGATKPAATDQSPYPSPSIWTSADGAAWARSFLPSASQEAVFLNDVAASPGLYVAVGRDASSAAAWVSSDGRSWHESGASPALADATMHRVVWLGNVFVAVGQSRFGDVGDGLAWVSSDGMSWNRLDTGTLFAGTPILAVGEINSRLVLFGNQSGAIVGAISAVP